MTERNSPPDCVHRIGLSGVCLGGGVCVGFVQDGLDFRRAELREACVDLRRAGEDVAGFQVILTAVEAADDASRLADDQAT